MILAWLTFALAAASAAVAQINAPRPDIVLDPVPPLIQCERAVITWSGGRRGSPPNETIPYAVGIYPEDWQDGGERLQYLGATGEMEEQWLVRVPAGTTVVIRVWDSLKEVYSEPAIVQEGEDESCLPTSTRSSSASATATSSADDFVTGTIAITGSPRDTDSPSPTAEATAVSVDEFDTVPPPPQQETSLPNGVDRPSWTAATIGLGILGALVLTL